MTPLSSVPERLRRRGNDSVLRCPAKRAPLRWTACRAFVSLRAPRCDPLRPRRGRLGRRLLPLSRVRKAAHMVRAGFSTQSVLLPESLRVCPFGGVAHGQQSVANALSRRVGAIYASAGGLSNGRGGRARPCAQQCGPETSWPLSVQGIHRYRTDDAQLRIEYHSATDGPRTKAPDDHVTVDSKGRRIARFEARDLRMTKQAAAIRMLVRTR
jgi:hypothetical protein